MSEPTYGYEWQDDKYVVGARNGDLFIPQVSEMQPTGHFTNSAGLRFPSKSKPSALKKIFLRWFFDVDWVNYGRR